MKYYIKRPFAKLVNLVKQGATACRGVRRGVKLRVVQRQRTRHHKTLTPPYTHCKNCGHELKGMYCHACGQYARDINPDLLNFVWQYCENAFQFDGKFWLTVRRLFAYPGRLSTEFMAGHVRRYVFPLKLYMLVAMVFGFIVLINQKASSNAETEKTRTEQTAKATSKSIADSAVAVDTVKNIKANPKLTDKENTERVKKAKEVHWEESGINFLTRLPIAMMFAMPMFALLSRFFFRRRYRKYLPHLIFSIHTHTVFFSILSLSLIIDTWGDSKFYESIIKLLLLWGTLYSYIAAIRFFGDPWWKVLVKNIFLYLLYYIFCILVIVFAFIFNLCYDSWAAGNDFLGPLFG